MLWRFSLSLCVCVPLPLHPNTYVYLHLHDRISPWSVLHPPHQYPAQWSGCGQMCHQTETWKTVDQLCAKNVSIWRPCNKTWSGVLAPVRWWLSQRWTAHVAWTWPTSGCEPKGGCLRSVDFLRPKCWNYVIFAPRVVLTPCVHLKRWINASACSPGLKTWRSAWRSTNVSSFSGLMPVSLSSPAVCEENC